MFKLNCTICRTLINHELNQKSVFLVKYSFNSAYIHTCSVKPSYIFSGRLLIQPTSLPIESVAFYAYISSTVPASTPHHILVFDKVITDVGNAYHPHMGTFIAPKTGLYVFTWTIRCNQNNYHSAELLVDNNIVNVISLYPGNAIDGTVTGTAVVRVNQGDDVFIRTGRDSNGNILSDENGRSSFAGWILM